MSKILFIAPYRESTGWGEASRRLILDIAKKYDVVTRCIRLGAKPVELVEPIKELESKNLNGVSHVVQCVLPHALEYFPGIKNIAAPFIDSLTLSQPMWLEKLKTMDKIWLFSYCQTIKEMNLDYRYVNVPARQISDKVSLKLSPDGIYRFYFIGEMNRRKNIAGLVEAFHKEFEPWEPVELILKLSHPTLSGPQLYEEAAKLCLTVKQVMRLRPVEEYRPEVLITEYMSEAQLDGLHRACNCFVSASFGEAWCLPAQDAATVGNKVIGPHGEDYICTSGLCTGVNDTFPGLMTAHDIWSVPTDTLRTLMRRAFRGEINTPVKSYTNNYKVLLK